MVRTWMPKLLRTFILVVDCHLPMLLTSFLHCITVSKPFYRRVINTADVMSSRIITISIFFICVYTCVHQFHASQNFSGMSELCFLFPWYGHSNGHFPYTVLCSDHVMLLAFDSVVQSCVKIIVLSWERSNCGSRFVQPSVSPQTIHAHTHTHTHTHTHIKYTHTKNTHTTHPHTHNTHIQKTHSHNAVFHFVQDFIQHVLCNDLNKSLLKQSIAMRSKQCRITVLHV
jgi:hypothetical protein